MLLIQKENPLPIRWSPSALQRLTQCGSSYNLRYVIGHSPRQHAAAWFGGDIVHRMIQLARALGMKVMLGCMISSSVTVTAAAHLSPLVDYADLDGNLLIANDPFRGVRVEKGKLILPQRPGLGLTAV